ncbi:hypothetical protein, partial [Ruminiclostridium hungatei]|uniref:hypothetical protein n=1 Tax=Ruminiclostridium hungatei TaxID=48256 RepID=UPI001054AF41
MGPEGAGRLCGKPGTIEEASAAIGQKKRRRLLRSARSNGTGGSRATMRQAGYNRRGERCHRAEEAKAFIAQRKEQWDRREQSDYAA